MRGWFSGILSNHIGEAAAWDWIRKDWDWLDKTVGGDLEFATFITVISRVFRTQARLDEFKKFFEPKLNIALISREIRMDTKVIATRIDLIKSQATAVNEAIKKALA